MNDNPQNEYPHTERFKKELKDDIEKILRVMHNTWFKITVYSFLFLFLGLCVLIFSLELFR